MCLAVPMEVINVADLKAVVRSHGIETLVDISLTPDVRVGDKVLVHAGFAIEVLDPEQALEIEETWDEYLKLLEEEDQAG